MLVMPAPSNRVRQPCRVFICNVTVSLLIVINKGDGYNTDDYTTGGVQAKFVCIGGCTFAESGDAYCCGIFAYAK